MIRKAAAAAIVSALVIFSAGAVFAAETITAGNMWISVDGEYQRLSERTFEYGGEVYIPVLCAGGEIAGCGFSWGNDEKTMFRADKDGLSSYIFMDSATQVIGYECYTYDTKPMMFRNTVYLPESIIEDITGAEIVSDGVRPYPEGYRDTLDESLIPDDYRISEESAQKEGVCLVLNRRYMFEPVKISDTAASEYAGIVNNIAMSVPAQVYCIIAPDSGEIYAPKRYTNDQLSSIRRIYKSFSEDVTPINVLDPLIEHADEHIYFRTDHHWTQLGAYYAYRAYAEYRGWEIPSIGSFENAKCYDFKGSWINYLGDKAGEMLDPANEELDRYLPHYNVKCSVYTDMAMKNHIGDVKLVDTDNNTYTSFIGGDYPLTVITGGADNGRSLVILKESFGDAFATWAVNNYSTVYVVDIREFNGIRGHEEPFKLSEFYALTNFDDLIIINYPSTVAMDDLRSFVGSFR